MERELLQAHQVVFSDKLPVFEDTDAKLSSAAHNQTGAPDTSPVLAPESTGFPRRDARDIEPNPGTDPATDGGQEHLNGRNFIYIFVGMRIAPRQ